MSEPMYKRVVNATSQLTAFRKIKQSMLPPIPPGFDPEMIAETVERTKGIWTQTMTYLDMIVKFHNLTTSTARSSACNLITRDVSKADAALQKAQKTILQVRDRCIHSVAYPEDYVGLGKKGTDELYLYWIALSCFDENTWCEYYTPYRGYSRYFMTPSRWKTESVKLEYEYYEMLKRFGEMFQFDKEEDKKLFTLFLDGYDCAVLADFMGESVAWVQEKLNRYVEMAKVHREDFYKLSLLDAEEELQDYRDSLGISIV